MRVPLVLLVLLGIALLFGPTLWVRGVMRRYDTPRPELPGSGGEFAMHLLDRLGLREVEAENIGLPDHYDPLHKRVRLSPANWEGRSLTAMAGTPPPDST